MSTDKRGGDSIAAKTVRGAGWIIGWRLVTRNIGLINTLILVRLLDPADFGLVAIASGFIATADALSWIGVQDALIREPKPDRAMYDTAFTLTVLRGLVTAAAILTLAWPVAALFADDRLIPIMLALVAGTVMTSFENIGVVDFRRDLAFHKEFQLQVWPRLAGVLTAIVTAFLLHDYWALVAGMLVGRLGKLIQTYVMSPYRPTYTLSAWRRLMGFSLWTWALTVMVQIRDRSDHAIIGRVLGTNAVGTFAVGWEIATLTTTELIEPLQRALFSGFASLQEESNSRASMYLGAVGLSASVILPAGVGVSMIAGPLVHLFLGPQWVAATGLIEIVSVSSTMSLLTAVGGAFLMASGRVRSTFWLLAQSVALRTPMMIVGVVYSGLLGAAVAAALSTAIDQYIGLRIILPTVGVRAWQVADRLWRPVAASLTMAGVMTMCGLAWTPATDTTTTGLILDLLSRSIVGAATYFLAISVLWLAAGRPAGAERYVLSAIRARLGRA